jgi:hypothetical protein
MEKELQRGPEDRVSYLLLSLSHHRHVVAGPLSPSSTSIEVMSRILAQALATMSFLFLMRY